MDFDDTPEEAAFRVEVRAWLEAHAPVKGGPEDFSTGFLENTMDPAEFNRRVQAFPSNLAAQRGGFVEAVYFDPD